MNIKKTALVTLTFATITISASSFGMQYLVKAHQNTKGALASLIRPMAKTDTSKKLIIPKSFSAPVLWTIAWDKKTDECLLKESYQLPFGYQGPEDMSFLMAVKIALRRFCLFN